LQKPDEKTSDRKNLCSGVILAGGLSTRLGGRNKAFLEIGGMRILDRIYGVFTELFDEIILVTNHPLLYLNWDVVITTDIFPIRSSLTGIHAGLFAVSNPYAFVAACDTPFLKKEVVQTILDGIETRFDVVIPETRAGLEPLCAAYSKRCLTPMTHSLKQEKFMIRR
jgi:molybdopterin-guanine dinucleotide biosynthesis protein A